MLTPRFLITARKPQRRLSERKKKRDRRSDPFPYLISPEKANYQDEAESEAMSEAMSEAAAESAAEADEASVAGLVQAATDRAAAAAATIRAVRMNCLVMRVQVLV